MPWADSVRDPVSRGGTNTRMVLAIPDENYGERGTVSDDPIIIAGESDSAYAVPFDSAPPLIHSLSMPFSCEHGFSAI